MNLNNKKIALLVADGFEEIEFTSPKAALEKAGATVEVISPNSDTVKSWAETNWGKTFKVDVSLEKARATNYNALVLPGGVLNPDQLRTNEKATQFVRDFFEQHKPVAAICHGPWTLINAEVVKGRHLTSYKSIRKDLENAGAHWEDKEVVTDQGLVTSRNPGDLEAFNKKMIEEIAEGKHQKQVANAA